jgi:RNA polymerase sigma factor (sigma-70 family)
MGSGIRVGEIGDLVLRARGGDRAAWDALVRRFAGLVLWTAQSKGVRPADCDDVAQVTWLKLAQNLDRLDAPDAVGAWLHTTCEREALRHVARAARQVPTEDEVFDRIAADTDVEETAIRSIGDPRLRTAFAKMSERCQLLLSLLLFDVPYEEISAKASMPIGSIGPTRQRCLDKLRRLAGITIAADGS